MRKILNRKGFTLIEVMCITVIVGIAAGLAFPKFETTIHRLRVRNAARNMVSTMRLARSFAITHKLDVGVHFDTEGEAMTMYVNTSNPATHYFDAGDSVLKTDTLPEAFCYVYGETYDPDDPCAGSSIVYHPNGSASASSYFYFMSYSQDDDIDWGTIDVLGATGRTKLSSLSSY